MIVRTNCYTHRKILQGVYKYLPERVLYKSMKLDFLTDKECKSIIEEGSGKTFDNINWPIDVSCAIRRYNETKADIFKDIGRKKLFQTTWNEVIFKLSIKI